MSKFNFENQALLIMQIQQSLQATKLHIQYLSNSTQIKEIKNNTHLVKLDLMEIMIATSHVTQEEWRSNLDQAIGYLIKTLFDFIPPTNLEAFAFLVKAFEDKLPISFCLFLSGIQRSITDEDLPTEDIEIAQPHYRSSRPYL